MRHLSPALAPLVTAALLSAALLGVTGCASESPRGVEPQDPSPAAASVALPPAGTGFDYQLGGSYGPAAGVGIVARDRTAEAAKDAYSICYINAFQTQPGERDVWPESALLMGADGPVIDPEWPDEILLDTSSSEQRAAIAAIVTPWIRDCADRGYDAVEFDNLDSFTRSAGVLSLDDNLALAATLVDAAHAAGLAAGQKNAAEYAEDLRREAGFDFAVSEECAAFRECFAYRDVYAEAVLDIEYTDALSRPFAEMCSDADAPPTMILRDRELRTPASSDYVFGTCSER